MNMFKLEHPALDTPEYKKFFERSKEALNYPDEYDHLLHKACLCHFTDGEPAKLLSRVKDYLVNSSNVCF